MFLLYFYFFSLTKGDFSHYKTINFNAEQLSGWLVCGKPDFVCFICRKYTMGKNSEFKRRGIRITDNVVFKIHLHFDKCFKVFLFFVLLLLLSFLHSE